MNPCPCGHLADPALACNKAPRCAADYQGKISGPLFDRIDLHIEVPAVTPQDLSLPAPREGSAEVAARVAAARDIQTRRYEKPANGIAIRSNAEVDGTALEDVAAPDADGRQAAHRRRRAVEAIGARLPPRAARRPHSGRSRR
jgi:magnesium chelatase family protein